MEFSDKNSVHSKY